MLMKQTLFIRFKNYIIKMYIQKNLNAGIKRNLNAEEHKEKNTNNFVTSPPVITTGTD